MVSQRGSYSRLRVARRSASLHGGPKSWGSSTRLCVRREDRWTYDVAFRGTTSIVRTFRKHRPITTPYLYMLVYATTHFVEVDPETPENAYGTWTGRDCCTYGLELGSRLQDLVDIM
jgi:hypothetical protein